MDSSPPTADRARRPVEPPPHVEPAPGSSEGRTSALVYVALLAPPLAIVAAECVPDDRMSVVDASGLISGLAASLLVVGSVSALLGILLSTSRSGRVGATLLLPLNLLALALVGLYWVFTPMRVGR